MNSALFVGHVEHRRLRPVVHEFRYPVYVYGLDLDELGFLERTLPPFGYNRFKPVSLHDRDYLDDSGDSLPEKLRRRLRNAGVDVDGNRILMVTSARYFHRVFNPVSFYFVLHKDGSPLCNVAEVNNTFGERHLYILTDPLSPPGCYPVRYTASKSFHVSPFNSMEGTYEFHFGDIARGLDVSVRLHREGEKVFEARIVGRRAPLTTSNLLRVLLRHPLIPHLTVPRILWQAARLVTQRKLPVYTKPIPSSPMTIRRNPPSVLERRFMGSICELFSQMRMGALRLVLPDGRELAFGEELSELHAVIAVRDYAFFRRIALGADVGLGESYMAGEWDSPSITDLWKVLIANREALRDENRRFLSLARETLDHAFHLARHNSLWGSLRNIRKHYDLSNEFFRLFLDDAMVYSCALYRTGRESLEEAQRNKLKSIMGKARIQAEDHVLEIGCGWGAFALEAARETGCRITGITLSREQFDLARRRISEAGLGDRVTILLRDYRHVEGRFDKIVSIEMLEAVGHRYFGEFFKCCDRLLKPEGLVVLQTITVADHRYDQYRRGCDWIQKHIFPGGHLPSLTALCRAMTGSSSLVVEHLENIGIHYAATLREWRSRFERNLQQVAELGFDRSFQRKWLYYLSFCEAAFATRTLGNLQLVLTRPNNMSLNSV